MGYRSPIPGQLQCFPKCVLYDAYRCFMRKGFNGEMGMGNAGQSKVLLSSLLRDFFEPYTLICIDESQKEERNEVCPSSRKRIFILEHLPDLVFCRTQLKQWGWSLTYWQQRHQMWSCLSLNVSSDKQLTTHHECLLDSVTSPTHVFPRNGAGSQVTNVGQSGASFSRWGQTFPV